MKYSILLPTRNRLEYLRLAVQSVLDQDVADWEIVISDNHSEEDIAGYVSGLGDPRIVYHRTERPLAVTDNWNRTLRHSQGEYVLMLGDDDALLPGYLGRMGHLIDAFGEPDIVYTKALLFTYPGVDPSHPGGFLMDHGCASFFAGAKSAFVLEHAQALGLVEAAMSFRLRYDFNAQFALMSRRLIDSLRTYGEFYQSDFPDYYSMNAAFLRAQRIVVDPSPRVLIGVTPKSYGYFHVNDLEAQGKAFLNGAVAPAPPGSNINVGWLSAVSALEGGVAGDFGLRVNHRRYRYVQAAHVNQRYRKGAIDRDEVQRLMRDLPSGERWAYRAASGAYELVQRLLPARGQRLVSEAANRLLNQLPAVAPPTIEGRYSDALEVCRDWPEPGP